MKYEFTENTMHSIVLFIIAVVVVICWASFAIGALAGAERACESVKMEWVNDKCMKATREEVK